MSDFVRRLSSALGTEVPPDLTGQDMLIHKASERVQETPLLRTRSTTMSDTLATVKVGLRSCRDALERALADRDKLQRQAADHILEIDRLRQVCDCFHLIQKFYFCLKMREFFIN
ncbi:uncharacterized protein LOC142331826 [Lycorma delicatula]|uniref:uncharacterized protein LOC142331826 n=1 Tax=Lycorma delicatula TaxID=130591 RepID=UPI003F512C8A